MKLQKQFSRKVGKIEYSKWVIVIPSSIIKELGWKEGEELETLLRNDKLILSPKKK